MRIYNSTDFSDFEILVKTIENSQYSIVSGSRIHRMGADITKDSARQIISKTINLIIRTILGMKFQDTQCGAKIFKKEIINIAFSRGFITRWLFDVEIFMRLKNYFGVKNATEMVCEVPLKRWIHADGSKLSYKDSMKIGFQLYKIATHYNRINSPFKVGKYDLVTEN